MAGTSKRLYGLKNSLKTCPKYGNTMHHNLHRFIQGIKLDNPKFDWTPQPWHSDLAKHIPAPAVYGIFGEASFNGEVIALRDDWQRADRFKDGVKAALGSEVVLEYVK